MNEAEVTGAPEANGAASSGAPRTPGRPEADPTGDARAAVRRALAADRAEAQAQLDAALALLTSVMPPPALPVALAPSLAPSPSPDLTAAAEALRDAAQVLHDARTDVQAAEARAARLHPADDGLLGAAATAAADAEAARTEIAPAWRRTAGSLISATGMAIIVASLTWPAWTYLIPTALVLAMAADLRVAASAARAASLRSAEAMAAAGVASLDGLAWARSEGLEREGVVRQLQVARQRADEAAAKWGQLAPGTAPADVEALIGRLLQPVPPPAPPPPPPPPEPEPLSPADERKRKLAETLAAEARAELARVDAALAELATYEAKPGNR